MSERSTVWIAGRESYQLRTNSVEAALTVRGAHLAPVTFFPDDADPIRPYAVAPWAEEVLPPDTPPVIAQLRGDWFCSAFGANAEPYRDKQLPLHGETANNAWRLIDRGASGHGCWLRLGMELPLQGGRCEATTALLNGQSVIYQRHELSGLTGPINPGHHATLAFPDIEGAGRLSFCRPAHMHTFVEPTENRQSHGYSCLKPDVEFDDLRAVPCVDGSTTDLSRYPARRGFDDIAIVCADPKLEFAWSAVTFPSRGFVWFALRDTRQLASTLLWFSNGGKHYPPWSGRHVNVMGIEDITGFFHVGLAASSVPNLLTRHGIPTCIEPDNNRRLSISYIQGVARIPERFVQLETIERIPQGILLIATSGVSAQVSCDLDFLRTGQRSRIELLAES